MRPDKHDKSHWILYILGALAVIWCALLIAPELSLGVPWLITHGTEVFQHPFQIRLCEDSLRTVLASLLIYAMLIGVYLSDDRNYRRREEHGSAKWGSVEKTNKKYADPDYAQNIILTQNVRIALEMYRHMRNLNILIVGGSGAGKTRFFAKPNIMQANTSFVILDPKGELLRDTAMHLQERGYIIKVIDLINMERSHCYNPFVYLRDDNDVQRIYLRYFDVVVTPEGEVIGLGARCLRIEAFAETMYAISIVGYGCCVGAGDTLMPSLMNFCSMWLVRIGLAAILTPKMGLQGYWIAMCAELNVRGILFLWRMKGEKWMKHNVTGKKNEELEYAEV